MNFTLQCEALRKPLQLVIGVLERRQTMPILGNILLTLSEQSLSMTATDLEIELIGRAQLNEPQNYTQVTVSGRKLFDICRSLPDTADIELQRDKERLILRSGHSRFILTTLPAESFPNFEENPSNLEFTITQGDLHSLLQRTHFAMAQQDVRYYLNGLLFEVKEGKVRTVATDGHRFAMHYLPTAESTHATTQIILPRKAVLELMRLLKNEESELMLTIGDNHLRIQNAAFTFTSKLIDGRFPDYERVLPRGSGKSVTVSREALKEGLIRAAILSNEKFRVVRFQLKPGLLQILANNPEQEEAEEILSVDYAGEELEIAFNATYLLDVLNTISSDEVSLTFTDSNSRIFIESTIKDGSLFLVMPLQV